MDTIITKRINGKSYNRDDEQVIECKACGKPTTMEMTKLCDQCWNAKGFFHEHELGMLVTAINREKKIVMDYPINRHYTANDKREALRRIDKIVRKLRGIAN